MCCRRRGRNVKHFLKNGIFVVRQRWWCQLNVTLDLFHKVFLMLATHGCRWSDQSSTLYHMLPSYSSKLYCCAGKGFLLAGHPRGCVLNVTFYILFYNRLLCCPFKDVISQIRFLWSNVCCSRRGRTLMDVLENAIFWLANAPVVS